MTSQPCPRRMVTLLARSKDAPAAGGTGPSGSPAAGVSQQLAACLCQRATAKRTGRGIVVRMCDCRCVDEVVEQAAEIVSQLVSRPVYALTDQALCDRAVVLHRIASQAIAALAQVAREARGRDLPRRSDAASTTTWLRDLVRVTPAEARQIVVLGDVMDARPTIARAIASGALNASQAAAIGRVVADVPVDEPTTADKVEAFLIERASTEEPTVLRRAGDRALAHVNPDLAD